MDKKIKDRMDSALYGVVPELRYQLYERIIGALSEHIPEERVDEACRWIDYHARQIDDIQGEM